MRSQIKLFTLSIASAAILLTSCSNDEDEVNESNELEFVSSETSAAFIQTYAEIAAANYQDAYDTALEMDAAIDDFLANPSAQALIDAQEAWLHARDFYGQTEAFREANGPIDNEDLLGTEGQINAWPLDEAYIDYVSDNRGGTVQNGLIGDNTFVITVENLIAANEDGGDANISTGWHAIEFLLWGQDLNYDFINHTTDNFSGSGDRDYTDYTTADDATRRSLYLEVVTDLLINDLRDLAETWAEEGSYRATFEALDEKEAITNILNGIGFISNGEVALERIDPAIDEGQENEHSCFSDNTNQDMWANVHGINNVITGSYTNEDGSALEGTSLIDLVATESTSVSEALEQVAENTLEKLENLLAENKNFDEIVHNETLGSNGVAGQLSTALKEQGVAISDGANSIGIDITIN